MEEISTGTVVEVVDKGHPFEGRRGVVVGHYTTDECTIVQFGLDKDSRIPIKNIHLKVSTLITTE